MEKRPHVLSNEEYVVSQTQRGDYVESVFRQPRFETSPYQMEIPVGMLPQDRVAHHSALFIGEVTNFRKHK